ncbi:unnamed protein product [Lathyrus sativus]|nr:unnamed protein product [Lathyrus sativus]
MRIFTKSERKLKFKIPAKHLDWYKVGWHMAQNEDQGTLNAFMKNSGKNLNMKMTCFVCLDQIGMVSWFRTSLSFLSIDI